MLRVTTACVLLLALVAPIVSCAEPEHPFVTCIRAPDTPPELPIVNLTAIPDGEDSVGQTRAILVLHFKDEWSTVAFRGFEVEEVSLREDGLREMKISGLAELSDDLKNLRLSFSFMASDEIVRTMIDLRQENTSGGALEGSFCMLCRGWRFPPVEGGGN